MINQKVWCFNFANSSTNQSSFTTGKQFLHKLFGWIDCTDVGSVSGQGNHPANHRGCDQFSRVEGQWKLLFWNFFFSNLYCIQDEAFGLWLDKWACIYEDGSESKRILESIHQSYYLVNLVDNDYPRETCLWEILEQTLNWTTKISIYSQLKIKVATVFIQPQFWLRNHDGLFELNHLYCTLVCVCCTYLEWMPHSGFQPMQNQLVQPSSTSSCYGSIDIAWLAIIWQTSIVLGNKWILLNNFQFFRIFPHRPHRGSSVSDLLSRWPPQCK